MVKPLIAVLFAAGVLAAVSPYHSLAGRSDEEIALFARNFATPGGAPTPGPINDTSAKLVNDWLHPWLPTLPGQVRGPCPGLNALASHGWLPRSGVATPGQIVTAVQEGFNMGWDLAVLVTYGAMLVDGNPLTNLMSIGGKTRLTGVDPPKPAIVGGLNTHGVFEGDASLTRGDEFFGDNHNFNETLFEEFIAVSNTFGGGKYNVTAASELRFARIGESATTNPEFFFSFPRYATAYAESLFPIAYFIGDVPGGGFPTDPGAGLDLQSARGFFQNSRMPRGFRRREGAFGLEITGGTIGLLINSHFVPPGANQGAGNFVIDQHALDILQGRGEVDLLCALYLTFVNTTMKLYPKATGPLKKSLAVNLHNFYLPVSEPSCPEQFPFGQP